MGLRARRWRERRVPSEASCSASAIILRRLGPEAPGLPEDQPSGTISIRTGIVEYNYVRFCLWLREDPTQKLKDGLTVLADVKEVDGKKLMRKRGMVFVDGTRVIGHAQTEE